MKKEDIEFLTLLRNTLYNISTCAENTIIMGECLRQLNQFIVNKENELKEE